MIIIAAAANAGMILNLGNDHVLNENRDRITAWENGTPSATARFKNRSR